MSSAQSSMAEARAKTELVALFGQIARYLTQVPGNAVMEVSPLLGDALADYQRCVSLFHSIRLLIEVGQPEEAGILGRSLFESSLRLDYLNRRSTTEREELLLHARMDALGHLERISEEEARHGGPRFSDEQIMQLRDARDALAAMGQARGLQARGYPKVREMATQLDRLDEYAQYLFGHELTHGTLLAQGHRRQQVSPDTVHVFSSNHEINAAASTGLMAARDVLVAGQAAGQMFGWPTPGMDELVAEAQRLREVIVSTIEID
jgi:hypothetical protein